MVIKRIVLLQILNSDYMILNDLSEEEKRERLFEETSGLV